MTDLQHRVDLLVFDFDGTLCDSTDAKSDGFYQLYLNEHGPRFATKVLDHHLANVGQTRYTKIRYIEEMLLETDPDDRTLEEIADRYGEFVRAAVIASPLMHGALDFLNQFSRTTPIVVASATPTDELRTIVTAHGLDGYFACVCGSPQPKHEIITDCIARVGADPRRTVMIGDQMADYSAAERAAVQFVGYVPDQEEDPFPADAERVDSFGALAGAINAVLARHG